ncbi:MAG: hypothetical protein QOE90_339 [Thermoplasmata archaeon]|jgi:hypothetical protein|nr:hypothetical protein [Thermoplasmata archaeon]
MRREEARMVEVVGPCPLCGQPIAAFAPNVVTAHGPGVCTPAQS